MKRKSPGIHAQECLTKNVNKNYIKLFTKSDATASFTNKRQMSEEEKKNKGS